MEFCVTADSNIQTVIVHAHAKWNFKVRGCDSKSTISRKSSFSKIVQFINNLKNEKFSKIFQN